MKKTVMTILAVIVTIGLLTAFEGKWDRKARPGQMQDRPAASRRMRYNENDNMGRLYDELELTSVQQDKWNDLRIKHRKEMIDLQADLEKLNIDRQQSMQDHNYDKVKKIITQIGEQRQKMALKRIDHHEKIWDLLTPEQRVKADELRKNQPRFRNHNKPRKR